MPDRYCDVSFIPVADEDERQRAIRRTVIIHNWGQNGARKKDPSLRRLPTSTGLDSLSPSLLEKFFVVFFPFHSTFFLWLCFLTISLCCFPFFPLSCILFFPMLWCWNTICLPDNEQTQLFSSFTWLTVVLCLSQRRWSFYHHLLVKGGLHFRSAWQHTFVLAT